MAAAAAAARSSAGRPPRSGTLPMSTLFTLAGKAAASLLVAAAPTASRSPGGARQARLEPARQDGPAPCARCCARQAGRAQPGAGLPAALISRPPACRARAGQRPRARTWARGEDVIHGDCGLRDQRGRAGVRGRARGGRAALLRQPLRAQQRLQRHLRGPAAPPLLGRVVVHRRARRGAQRRG